MRVFVDGRYGSHDTTDLRDASIASFVADAVAVTRDARRRWLVRILRLAGGAPLPEFFEIDDSIVVGGAEASGADMPHFTSGGGAAGPHGQVA